MKIVNFYISRLRRASDVAQQPLPWSGRSKDRLWFESTFWILPNTIRAVWIKETFLQYLISLKRSELEPMSPRALFRHQVATSFCLSAKRVNWVSLILSSGLFWGFFYAKENMAIVSHVDAFTPSMGVIFFVLLSPWVLGTRKMSCILAIIVFIFRWR